MRLFSNFKCEKLDWHKPEKIRYYAEGDIYHVNTLSRCKYCGRRICQDSQGNWFTFGKGD